MTRITALLLAGVAAIGVSSAAQAADLIIQEPVMTPGVVDVGGNWEGVYLGAFIGGASGTLDPEFDNTWFNDDDSLDVSGWLVGVNAGANFYITDGVVGGVVGDIAWSDISGSLYSEDYANYTINWQGSLRGKLGFDAGAFMPYLTGGLAFANGTFDYDGGSDSQTHVGWTVGAGVEIAATEDLSIDVLYRYSDFGKQTYFGESGSELGLSTHAVTVGLNWKF